MTTTTTCYFVRHAQSAPSLAQAHPEWPLSALGQEQARKLVGVLAPLKPDALYSSPYRRCLETLSPFATSCALPIIEAEALREKVTSLTFRKDFSSIYRQSWTYRNFALPGTESSFVCAQRMLTFVKSLAKKHPGKTLVLASHGHALALLLNACWKGFGYQEALGIRNPDIFKLKVSEDGIEWDQSVSFLTLLGSALNVAAQDIAAQDFRSSAKASRRHSQAEAQRRPSGIPLGEASDSG